MGKSQYRFNPDEMNYNRLDDGLRSRFWRGVIVVAGVLVMAILLTFLYMILFDSPRERQVRRENEELKRQHAILKERKQMVDTVIREIKHTDENIYRLIFETEPVEEQLGAGTMDPYQALLRENDRDIVLSTAHRVDSLLEKTNRENLDYDVLRIKSEDKQRMLPHIPAIQPVENRDLTRTASGFGYRIHPFYKIRKFHTGMDYTAPVGTPVFATGRGTVELAERSRRGSGNRVVVDHGFGFKSVYAHLSEIRVRRGQTVGRGDMVGTVGNTGFSIAPHLHYEVVFRGKPVNPVNFFFLELEPEAYDKLILLSKKSGQSFD